MSLGKKVFHSVTAGLLSAGLLLGGMSAGTAFAGGGGGNRPGQSGGSTDVLQFWQYKDDESGSWGSASDIQSVHNAMNAAGVTMNASGVTAASAVLADARTECENGFKQRHPNEGNGDCRVVAVGAGYTTSTKKFDGSAIQAAQWWKDLWYKDVAKGKYNYAGTQSYSTSDGFADDPNTSVDKLMEKAVTDTTTIIIIVLDKYQPAPPNYTLTITTNQQSANVKAGTAGVVRDVIHASNGGSSTRENVNAEVILHYKGQAQGYAAEQQVSKSVSIANDGDPTSPDFTPSDFGWNLWADGTYWFDVRVAKQGKMAEAVDTKDEEPTETFNLASGLWCAYPMSSAQCSDY